jgi:hypothetical protein
MSEGVSNPKGNSIMTRIIIIGTVIENWFKPFLIIVGRAWGNNAPTPNGKEQELAPGSRLDLWALLGPKDSAQIVFMFSLL